MNPILSELIGGLSDQVQNNANWFWFIPILLLGWLLTHVLLFLLKKPLSGCDKWLKNNDINSLSDFHSSLRQFILSFLWLSGTSFLDLPYLPILLKIWFAINGIRFARACSFLFIDIILNKYQKIDPTYLQFSGFIKRISSVSVSVLGVLILFQHLGFNVTSVLAGLGIGGLALALAAKDTLSNIFGSVVILFDRPFVIGDWVSFNDIEGTVIEIGFRSTQIKTFYDSIISIPNSVIANATIDNIGKRKYRRTRFTLGVTYSTSPDQIQQFVKGIQDILKSHPKTKDNFNVAFSGFADSSLSVFVNFFLQVSDWTGELEEREVIYLSILKLATSLGVDFAFPSQSLYFENNLPSKPEFKG